MLTHWIKLINQNKDHYGCDLWKYNISGNVMELLAIPSYDKNREKYRCSVIKIGQVLQFLSTRIDENQINCHIQSFPNIENPGLIASIRINHKKNQKQTSVFSESPETPPPSPGGVQTLLSLASDNQLVLDPIPQSQFATYQIDLNEEKRLWYILSSGYDNPFTWLKIGYWNELVYQTLSPPETSSLLIRTELCSRRFFSVPPEVQNGDRYLQAVVGLKI